LNRRTLANKMGNFYSTLLKNYKLFLHRIFPDDEDATVDKRKVYYTQEFNNERSKQSRNRKKMRISQVKNATKQVKSVQ
jgi:hypothetical protein